MVAQVAVFLLVSVSSGVWGLGERLTRGEREAVTRYLLSRMLGASSSQAREQGDYHGASSIVYPQVRWSLHLNNHIKTLRHLVLFQISSQQQYKPLQRLLDHAKENFDVIDFRDLQHRQVVFPGPRWSNILSLYWPWMIIVQSVRVLLWQGFEYQVSFAYLNFTTHLPWTFYPAINISFAGQGIV